MSASPYYDGDFTVASQVGQPIWEQPFLERGDPGNYIYKVPMMQLRSSYVAIGKDVLGPYGGYSVGDSGFRDEGGGVVSFAREYALIPATRSEYESYVYSYQVVFGSEISENPLTVKTRVQYDYFRTLYPNDIPLGKAPRAVKFGDTVYQINGFGSLVVGQEALAEDAVARYWKGNIYERVQRFFTVQTFA